MYPDSGIYPLVFLLKNNDSFFTLKSTKNSIEAITTLFAHACRSSYGIDRLA